MKKVTLEQKMSMKSLLTANKTYAEIASELGLSKSVVRKWCQRIKKGDCLTPKMGRPKKGSLSTFSKLIIDKIDLYRPDKEGWAADTIKVELELCKELIDLAKPSAISINRYLASKNRVKTYSKHSNLAIEPVVATKRPHDLWQLDAEGNCYLQNIGYITMINIKEIHCKVYVQHFPCRLAGANNHATTRDYQNVLRLGMMYLGMPKGIQVDHESIYFDNVNPSPFPTTFHLWLIGLKMKMHLTPKGKPFKQGSVERSHQTIQNQVIKGQTFNSWQELFARCQQRRDRLNYHIPCRSLNKQAPLVANPKAKHSGRFYQPKQEEKLFDRKRIHNYLAKGKWYRKISTSKICWLGSNRYYLTKAKPNTETMIKFDKKTLSFIFHDADENVIASKIALGLTFRDLAGDLNGFLKQIKKYPNK